MALDVTKLLMPVQICACSPGIQDHVPTTQSTGTLIRTMVTAVVSGMEAVMAMITAFSHEKNVKIDVSRHQALVCIITNLFVKFVLSTCCSVLKHSINVTDRLACNT